MAGSRCRPARPPHRIRSLALCIGAIGCAESTGPVQPPFTTVSVAVAADSGSVFRTLRISLPDPSGVQVDYWPADGPRLRVIDTVATADHAVFLPALRPASTYRYEVRRPGRGLPQPVAFHGELTTDSLPADLAALVFSATGTSSHRLTMLELRGTPFSGYVVVDQAGVVVWFRRGVAESFARRANGDFVFLEAGTALIESRPDLTEVARLAVTQNMSMHHDVIATPSNSLLFLTTDPFDYDGITWVGDAVWEWRPEAGISVRRWSAKDFLSPDTDLGPKSVPADWLHANSLHLGPRGNVLVSLPALNQVVSIASDYERLEWRLGGPNATIVPDPFSEFWFEHTAQEIAPNHVLLFDNGRDRPGGLFSRAVELVLDPVAGTATTAWAFRPTPDIYAPIVGSARRASNGGTLVGFGTRTGVLGSTGPIVVHEVAADGTPVWTLRVAGGELLNYRATPLADLAGERVVKAR